MKIPELSFVQAGAWIKRNGRPLEAARWEYKFENGSPGRVKNYLAAYQNPDGGFGHGIEPDFWLPGSSPTASWAAGRVLIEIKADSCEPMVQSLISYLVDTPQVEPGIWPTVLPEINHYAHAPWWEWKEDIQKNWMFNPSVELAALLINWSTENSKAWQLGWYSLEKAVAYLMQCTEMDMHEISNYQMFHKLLKPYANYFNSKMKYTLNEVYEQIKFLAEKCVDRVVANWFQEYTALPLIFVDSPDDPLCLLFGSLVEENLRFYAKQITSEGVWEIPWDWDSNFPEEFAVAKCNWKGILAIERYSKLKSFRWLH